MWLRDVDGLINATRPGWGSPPRRASVYADSGDWPMRWAPALIDRPRGLHQDGAVELRWCSTRCARADQLEGLWRLPPLVRTFCEPLVGRAAAAAKLAAARQVLADRRPLIWTDDTEVPRFGPLYDELTADGRGPLIAPNPRRGLQPDHVDAVEAFATRNAAA